MFHIDCDTYDTYDNAIITYHECDNCNAFIYRYPLNIIFSIEERLQKSSKHRIKFEDGELHREYIRVKRNAKNKKESNLLSFFYNILLKFSISNSLSLIPKSLPVIP